MAPDFFFSSVDLLLKPQAGMQVRIIADKRKTRNRSGNGCYQLCAAPELVPAADSNVTICFIMTISA
jgi:hypothetical protein